MVDSVKCCGKIKKREKRDVVLISRNEEIVSNLEEGSFGAVASTVSRLKGIEEVVCIEMVKELLKNNSFCELGEEREIGDWSIVFHDIRVERWFLE